MIKPPSFYPENLLTTYIYDACKQKLKPVDQDSKVYSIMRGLANPDLLFLNHKNKNVEAVDLAHEVCSDNSTAFYFSYQSNSYTFVLPAFIDKTCIENIRSIATITSSENARLTDEK